MKRHKHTPHDWACGVKGGEKTINVEESHAKADGARMIDGLIRDFEPYSTPGNAWYYVIEALRVAAESLRENKDN